MEAANLHNAGTTKLTKKLMNDSKTTLASSRYKWLSKWAINKKRWLAPPTRLSQLEKDTIYNLSVSGASARAIAQLIKRNENTVNNYKRKSNLTKNEF